MASGRFEKLLVILCQDFTIASFIFVD
jgi:hypothetical protein